ncbi:unnamed protein product [Phytomonas sp. EM1]|nr:unnamed protein product [Phytomonas sp. EM1]|eukprot:CCW64174.1 unnamed protein product [Phytomonas sp. isolate EM1]
MSDIFRKASRQVAAAPSPEHSLAAVRVIPAQSLPPLLTVDILHCIASNPRPCIAQIGGFRATKRPRSPQDATKPPVQWRETSLDLLSPMPATTPEGEPRENSTQGGPHSSSRDDGNQAAGSCESTFFWPDGMATQELALTLDHLLQGRSVAVFGLASKYPFLQHVTQSAELLSGFVIKRIDASRGSPSFQTHYGTAAVVHQLREVRDLLLDTAPQAPAKRSSPPTSGGWNPGADRSHAINVDDETNSFSGVKCSGRDPPTWWETEAEGLSAGGGTAVPFFDLLHPGGEGGADGNSGDSNGVEGSDAYPQLFSCRNRPVHTSLAEDLVEIPQEETITQRLPPPYRPKSGSDRIGYGHSGHPVEPQEGEMGASWQRGGFPYELWVPPIRFVSDAARQTWFKRCRGHVNRCVRWNVLPSIMAWRSMPCPPSARAPFGVVPTASGNREVGGWVRALAERTPRRVLLALHNVDLLGPASEAALLELCREFAYPRMRLVLLLSFDNPQWPLTARAAAFGQFQLVLVHLCNPLLPRVHEMRSLNSLGVLTQLEASTAGRGGATAGFAKGRNRAPLRDTIRRILLSLPAGFAELLRVLIATQAKHGEAASIPIFTIEQEFEAHGIMVSHGRMKAVQRELTSNRLAVYNPAEHALHIPQYRRLQEVLEEVNAMRSGGVEQRGFAETV